MVQPGVSGSAPGGRPVAKTSGGVFSSRPSQKGQVSARLPRSLSLEPNWSGRAARPGARIVRSPRELVDPDLWSGGGAQDREGGRSSGSGGSDGAGGGGFGTFALLPPVLWSERPMNGSSTSIGSGKTTVVFWLLPISSSVCR